MADLRFLTSHYLGQAGRALFLGALLLLPPAAPAEAQKAEFGAIQGRYAPDGDCAVWPRLTVDADRMEFYGWEGGDILFLDQWRDCPECLPEFALTPGEVRVSPIIDPRNPGAAPVLRFNPDGATGLMIAEHGGDLTAYPELAAVVEFGALVRCDAPQITAAAAAPPVGDELWRRFDTGARTGAAFCPVLDPSRGTRLCFNLGCDLGAPLAWELLIDGTPNGFAPQHTGRIDVDIFVDGALAARIPFARPEAGAQASFRAPFDQSHGTTLVQLQRGARAELRLAAGGQTSALMMSLRGSSRALGGVVEMCRERLVAASPRNRPDRFVGIHTGPGTDAVPLARTVMAAHLVQMREAANAAFPGVAPGGLIDVQAGWLTKLDSGWGILVSTVGPSNFHFGMSGFGTFVWAAPPGGTWRRIGPDTRDEALVWIDPEKSFQGWPRLVFQSTRGMNPSFHAWRWDGRTYVYDQEIPD